VAVVTIGAYYNFRLIGVGEIYSFRGEIEFPGFMRYAIGAASNAMFAFAAFVARGDRWRAVTALLLLLLLYPIMLTKLALFAPFWLLFLALLRGSSKPEPQSCCPCCCRCRQALSSPCWTADAVPPGAMISFSAP